MVGNVAEGFAATSGDNQSGMFQLHVILDQPRSWFQYAPPWVTAAAALTTVIVAVLIARNQSRLQKTLADKQIEIQKMQLEQQARQLKKDLFDRRFAVFTGVLEFIGYVLRQNGNIELPGAEYRQFCDCRERAEMLFEGDVNRYLADVDETARAFYVSAQARNNAITAGDMDKIHEDSRLMERLGVRLLQQRKGLFWACDNGSQIAL